MKKVLFSLITYNSPLARSFSTKYVKPVKIDPGIHKRRKVLHDAADENMEFDEYESDFMNVNVTHKQHVQQMKTILEKDKYHIVKQKYFKQKYPNFLTWQDKEQMRYLHNKDPEEWCVDKLSEGFPALPHVIHKIVKSKYTKTSQQKIFSHDAAVQNNWKLFEQGEIEDLPAELAEHLRKFTKRSLHFTPFVIPEEATKNQLKLNENQSKPDGFSEIIESYNRLKNKTTPKRPASNLEIKPVKLENAESDTYILGDKAQFKDKQVVTLNQLTNRLEKRVENDETLAADEQVMLQKLQEPKEVESSNNNDLSSDIVDLTKNKYNSPANEVGTYIKKTEKDMSHLMYPEKITIPKKYRRRGYTYKLNDCYYDYDGEFLYRVPGMG